MVVKQLTMQTVGAGKEAGITIAYEGLKLGFYGAERERTVPKAAAATGNYEHDEFNGAWYAKYSMGPVSIGYSETYMDAGVTQAIQLKQQLQLKQKEQLVVSLQVSKCQLRLT